MTNNQNPQPHQVVYEVNLSVPKSRQQALLEWLHPHIDEMLELPGFVSAQVYAHDDDLIDIDKFQTTVHYHLDSPQSMTNYFDQFAERMRGSGQQLFKDDLTATRRVLQSDRVVSTTSPNLPATTETYSAVSGTADVIATASSTCMDCATALSGDFCHNCGQKKQRRLISVFTVIAEFFSGAFNWDSRFWRTMLPLLFKPGRLTESYLNGQRARYIPPIRLYFVASLVFFLLISMSPQHMIQKNVGDTIEESGGITINVEGEHEDCEKILTAEKDFEPEFFREPAYRLCNGFSTESGLRRTSREFLDTLPATLLISLPIMAFMSWFFYVFSKRFYVEHLLFYVHSYSFLFVFLSIQYCLQKLIIKLTGYDSTPVMLVIAAAYSAYYFLGGMKVMYRQSWRRTFVKWIGLVLVFAIVSSFLILGTFLKSAVTAA